MRCNGVTPTLKSLTSALDAVAISWLDMRDVSPPSSAANITRSSADLEMAHVISEIAFPSEDRLPGLTHRGIILLRVSEGWEDPTLDSPIPASFLHHSLSSPSTHAIPIQHDSQYSPPQMATPARVNHQDFASLAEILPTSIFSAFGIGSPVASSIRDPVRERTAHDAACAIDLAIAALNLSSCA